VTPTASVALKRPAAPTAMGAVTVAAMVGVVAAGTSCRER
jgi:hypothetical protein